MSSAVTWRCWLGVCHRLVERMYNLDLKWRFSHWFDVDDLQLSTTVLINLFYNSRCSISVEQVLQEN